MFDIFPKLLSSVASFLFPLFASYKALKTSDPAELTPWLMYWVVLACALLVESWTEWLLVWIPFYAYFRLFFLLYLVLPQTQGARIIYQSYVHPWLEENESSIEDFIASAHDRLKRAGIAYLKRAIELLKTSVLGMPPGDPEPAAPQSAHPESYTQSLLKRFSLPSARWAGGAAMGDAGSPGTAGDFYSLLASAVAAATSAATGAAQAASRGTSGAEPDLSASGTLIPPTIRGDAEKMSFLSMQRERLATLLSALDREAAQISSESSATSSPHRGAVGGTRLTEIMTSDSDEPEARRPSSVLSKSRSEADFEKIEAGSGVEDMGSDEEATTTLRRRGGMATSPGAGAASGSWMPWGWGGSAGDDAAKSSGFEN